MWLDGGFSAGSASSGQWTPTGLKRERLQQACGFGASS